MKIKSVCTMLFVFYICYCNGQQYTNDNVYCINGGELFSYNICTNDYTDSLIIDTYGLKVSGIAYLHYTLYFSSIDTNKIFFPDSGHLVRIFYRESLEKPYMMDRLLVTKEEEIFFELLEKQIWDIVSTWHFFVEVNPIIDIPRVFIKNQPYTIDLTTWCIDSKNPHKIDNAIKTKLLKLLFDDSKNNDTKK